MLRSEINELEISVGTVLQQGYAENLPAYQLRVTEEIAAIKLMCANLKKKWTQELLSNVKEQVIRRYIQFHQAGIISLSDDISRKVPTAATSAEIRSFWTNLLQQLTSELENVLAFLHRKFYHFFDSEHKASIPYCQQLMEKISGFEADLIAYANPAVDTALIEAILRSVEELALEGMVSGISYRQADQCFNVVRMVHHLLYFGSNPTTERLVKRLYQQNFNSLHFFNWYQGYISIKLAEIRDDKSEASYIQNELKDLAGIYVSPEKAFQPELPATDQHITQWLQQQDGSATTPSGIVPAEQFPLNLSVPQFALFIRIFYKTGCFPIDNVAMITRFFSQHFTTKKQPHISYKSFGRAFYNLDQTAAAVVRDFLQKMINYLNKTYFP